MEALRVSAMRFSERARECPRLARHDHECERDLLIKHPARKNRACVSKPIEITARRILVCHHRRGKHPSAMRKIRNDAAGISLEGELISLVHPQRLERLEPLNWPQHALATGTTDFLWRSRDKRARDCLCLMLLVNCCILSPESSRFDRSFTYSSRTPMHFPMHFPRG